MIVIAGTIPIKPEHRDEATQLTPEKEQALKGWEVRKLYDMGANPLLLLVYSLATSKDMAAYARAINQKS